MADTIDPKQKLRVPKVVNDPAAQGGKQPWFKTTSQRALEAAGVAGDMKKVADEMVADSESDTARVVGEITGGQGVGQSTNPYAQALQVAGETARARSADKRAAKTESLGLKQQAIKAAGEAADAMKNKYNEVYAALAAEAKRLGGFGGWMTKQEKDQFTRFKDAQLAQLDPDQAAQLSASVKNV